MKRFFTLFALAGLSVSAFAQSNLAVADLQQDFALLKREVGKLRLEVEQLRAENEKMAEALRKAQASNASTESANLMANSLRSEMASKDDATRREILAQVKKELDSMAAQTNENLKKLANAIGKAPVVTEQKTFSADYPQNGIEHIIASGDTLSGIAKKYKSKVKWIQDANKIADPSRDLIIGKAIFVPQEN